MSIWKPFYEIQANGNITIGSVSSALKIVNSACDIKVALIQDKYGPGISNIGIFPCNEVGIYTNTLSSNASNGGCGYLQNMAVNGTTLPKYTFNQNIYHDYMYFNLNGLVAESRWFDGEHTPVPPIPVTEGNYHLKWFAELDCILFATENSVAGDMLEVA